MITQSTEFTVYTATYDGDPEYSAPISCEYGSAVKVRVVTHNCNPELTVIHLGELQLTIDSLKHIMNCMDDHLDMVTE